MKYTAEFNPMSKTGEWVIRTEIEGELVIIATVHAKNGMGIALDPEITAKRIADLLNNTMEG